MVFNPLSFFDFSRSLVAFHAGADSDVIVAARDGYDVLIAYIVAIVDVVVIMVIERIKALLRGIGSRWVVAKVCGLS